jgi:hypothetical protein
MVALENVEFELDTGRSWMVVGLENAGILLGTEES